MSAIVLHPTRCAICQTEAEATELYPANFDEQAFNSTIFSARRSPDRIHYRLVRCNACGLVRSDPVASFATMSQLYTQSSFDYGEEVANLQRTYGRYLAKLTSYGNQLTDLLEIGCGNGFFLEEAVRQGFTRVCGVEPSQDAIAKASPTIRPHIRCAMMQPGLFEAAQFDAICLFQVLDHIPDPASLVAECFRLLKPGGLMLCINHNVDAWSARLLGRNSPIVDIEHTYLYSPATMAKLFSAYQFELRESGAVWNDYSLYYLVRLLPLAKGIKQPLLSWLKASPLGQWLLSVPLGNLYLIAQKPVLPLE
jgi:SAM-dependent methyltransferase